MYEEPISLQYVFAQSVLCKNFSVVSINKHTSNTKHPTRTDNSHVTNQEQATPDNRLRTPYTSIVTQEAGFHTLGHECITREDRKIAKKLKCSLLYGELLPSGVNKVCRH